MVYWKTDSGLVEQVECSSGRTTMKEIIGELEKKLEIANKAYWEDCDPVITDSEYDSLVEELRELDPENPLVSKIIDREPVGEKIIHKKPMLSLEKVYGREELFKWVASRSRSGDEIFLIQPKYDGISGKLEDGILSTRGNGFEGTNITSRLPIVEFETKTSDPKLMLGEILITDSNFKERFPGYETKSGKPFKNQRNGVAGIMGCDDVQFYAKQGLKVTFVDYDLNTFEVKSSEFQELWDEIKSKIEELDYPMDGIVVKVKDQAYYESLGGTDHHPKGFVAFKFANKTKISHIINIEIGQGKENLTAVAICEPVEFEGVTVSRVKIPMTPPVDSNLPCISKREISIGDEIEIERSGDVVPNAVRILRSEKSREPFSIDSCPFCGASLEINPTSVRCLNEDCFEKKLRKLDFSLSNMGFIGVGLTNLRKIMIETGIEDLGQFMDLTKEDLVATGIGPGNSENIYNEKERCRKNKPERILASLNIPSLGNTVAKNLLKVYSLDEITEGLSLEELKEVPMVGDITATDLARYLKEQSSWIKSVLGKFDLDQESKESRGTICFTGKSSRPRSEMERAAREKGYEPTGAVGKDLSILVCADPESSSSKTQKAKKLGVKIMSEDEFWAL